MRTDFNFKRFIENVLYFLKLFQYFSSLVFFLYFCFWNENFIENKKSIIYKILISSLQISFIYIFILQQKVSKRKWTRTGCSIKKKLTSSKGQPVERKTACDCNTSSFKSLSLISPNGEGLQRNMTMRSVTTDVSSPIISQTGTTGLSEIFSKGIGFQFLIIREPIKKNYFKLIKLPMYWRN